MSHSDCIFCQMIRGKLPSQKVFENEKVLGFKDIKPSAKIHNLFIHKEHSRDFREMSSSQLTEVFFALQEWTRREKLLKNGFRVITNVGPYGGQVVFHTHFHVLGGEALPGF